MGSVVTKDVPAYEVWAGNPAKLIRKRFEDSKISKLKEIQWWDFSDQKLEELSKYFIDLEEFIEKENERK
ncbi:hypothetical protein SAMN04487975_10910 [Planococcus glaciei]|nr:hypothetical protein SAMN04487975_10910 [Planococcus glaciei]